MDPIAFRRLARADFPLLERWLATPQVLRWWNHESTLAAIEADFGPSIAGDDPAEIHLALLDERPVGLVQWYRFADNPDYIDELAPLIDAPPAALSLDYFVGEPALLGQGLGTAMIAAAVERIWRDYPQAPCLIVPVNVANAASWRALERVGFARAAQGTLAPDNPVDTRDHYVYRLDRPRR